VNYSYTAATFRGNFFLVQNQATFFGMTRCVSLVQP
jgi:hypothetical protein